MRRQLVKALTMLAVLLMALVLLTLVPATAQEELMFRKALRSDVVSLNPFLQSLIEEWEIFSVIYDKLFDLHPNGTTVPWLAKDYSFSPDGKVWTFTIHEGARFHDGEPLTAEDVAYTFELVIKYKFPRLAELAELLEKVEVVDDYTVRVYCTKPMVTMMVWMSDLWIMPKHIWEKVEDPTTYANLNPIGSGPFKWEERVPGDYIKLSANKEYWQGAPAIDTLVFKVYRTADAQLMAVRKGEVDAMGFLSVPPHLVPYVNREVETDPNLEIHLRKPVYFLYLSYNLFRYPFNVKEFRVAMAHAVNTKEMVEVIYGGFADSASMGTLPPVLGETPEKWFNPNVMKEDLYPFDLDRASSILDDLDFIDRDGDGVRETPNGTRLEWDILASTIYSDRIRAAEMIRDWFAEVGIKLNVAAYEHRTVVVRYLQKDFDVVVLGLWLTVDPYLWSVVLHSSNAVPGGFNPGYVDEEMDRLVEDQSGEMDVAKRKELWWKIQEKIAEDVMVITLCHNWEAFVYRVDKYENFVLGVFAEPTNEFTFLTLRPKAPPPPPPPPPGPAIIMGKVTDAETGSPVSGATVTVNGYQVTTGADGTYSLSVKLGKYIITVSTEGYETRMASVDASEEKTYTVNVSIPSTPTPPPPTPWMWITVICVVIAIVAVAFAVTRRR